MVTLLLFKLLQLARAKIYLGLDYALVGGFLSYVHEPRPSTNFVHIDLGK